MKKSNRFNFRPQTNFIEQTKQDALIAEPDDGVPPMTLPLATASNYNDDEDEQPGPPLGRTRRASLSGY
jgi:hypothetical protein